MVAKDKKHIINLLVVGHKSWYNRFIQDLKILPDDYTVEYISDINAANARLWHNSYDILLLEEQFSKEHTIKLSQMSYAMSRPSIILCKNQFKLFSYNIWKALSKFTNSFITSKKLIFFRNERDKRLINFINELANHHQFFDIITQEIDAQTINSKHKIKTNI